MRAPLRRIVRLVAGVSIALGAAASPGFLVATAGHASTAVCLPNPDNPGGVIVVGSGSCQYTPASGKTLGGVSYVGTGTVQVSGTGSSCGGSVGPNPAGTYTYTESPSCTVTVTVSGRGVAAAG